MLCGPDGVCNLAVFESLSDEFNDSLLPFAGNALPVAFASEHSCLRYSRVASLTRLIPPVMPNLRKSRLKCAFTVRRAILSCRAISSLSQPCSSRSAICCSRGPNATDSSFMPYPRGWTLPHRNLEHSYPVRVSRVQIFLTLLRRLTERQSSNFHMHSCCQATTRLAVTDDQCFPQRLSCDQRPFLVGKHHSCSTETSAKQRVQGEMTSGDNCKEDT